MLVQGIHSAAGNGWSLKEGTTAELRDDIAQELVRAGLARPAQAPIQTMKLNQEHTGATQARQRRKEIKR